MASPIYSAREAAGYLGVGKRRVLQLAADGRLAGTLTSAGWIFEQADLDRARERIRPYRRRSGDADGAPPDP